MKVNLKNNKGKVKKINLNFSFLYFFLGPVYFLLKGYFFRFLLSSFLYVTLIWSNFLNLIYSFLNNYIQMPSIVEEISLLPKEEPIYSFILLGIVHLLFSILTPRVIVKKSLKKKDFHPQKEIDTQKLIKYNLVKVGRKSYDEIFYPKEGLSGKIKISDQKEIKKEIDNLAKLLKNGMITQDEYNEKRIHLIMSNKKK